MIYAFKVIFSFPDEVVEDIFIGTFWVGVYFRAAVVANPHIWFDISVTKSSAF